MDDAQLSRPIRGKQLAARTGQATAHRSLDQKLASSSSFEIHPSLLPSSPSHNPPSPLPHRSLPPAFRSPDAAPSSGFRTTFLTSPPSNSFSI
ncbi:unnamed protein product [Parascedosporium putredinis]|uniref:Uncharacterized protein n=1 Tax=Parascedosporium putredinis TaxID=1442378 RepID=A0A9P1M7M6_9PEZI|nr:unnamed protein product [Parascedosporium putredinis]CAI7987853.1 unnamed protein product [Parascedosporium putredinis]